MTGLDLRLVPTAIAVWLATAAALVWTEATIAATATLCAVGGVIAWGFSHQRLSKHQTRGLGRSVRFQVRAARWLTAANSYLVLPVVGMMLAVVGVGIRRRAVASHVLNEDQYGIEVTELTLKTAPRLTEFGAMAKAEVAGLPGTVHVFGSETLMSFDRGTVVQASALVKPSTRPSLSGLSLVLKGEPEVIASPSGVVATVREGLQQRAAELWVGPDRLLPAMTIGDERGFQLVDHDLMSSAGLSHLTAVSGANVMLVVGAVLACVSWAPPRVRAGAAALALGGFVAVVGTEPSVLRAMLTGAVGLLAIVIGRTGQAIPALAGGAVVLLLLVPDFAVSVGFMLSVSATAGLVLLAEPVARRLVAGTWLRRWPAPIVRAIAVAVVAQIATIPVLMVFIGEYSHISVIANLLVSAAVPPVTILGTLAAVAVAAGLGPIATGLLWVAAPFASWIYLIAQWSGRASHWIGLDSSWISLIIWLVAFALLWKWPQYTVPPLMTAAALTALFGLLTWIFAWYIPRVPDDWSAAACAIDDRVLVIAKTHSAAPSSDPPSTFSDVAFHAALSSRTCRIALSLHDESQATIHVTYADEWALDSESLDSGSTQAGADTAATEHTGEPTAQASGNGGEYIGHSVAVPNPRHIPPDFDGDFSTRWIIAGECDERVRRIVVTPSGIPVVCPGRDGPQALMPDGTIWRGW